MEGKKNKQVKWSCRKNYYGMQQMVSLQRLTPKRLFYFILFCQFSNYTVRKLNYLFCVGFVS